MNPSTAASSPTSERRFCSVSRTNGVLLIASSSCTRATSSIVRIGFSMIGPLSSGISKSIPIPGSGVRISEKRMTPSGLNARHGCREISVERSVFSERSRNDVCFLARSWYTFMYRPACRIIHTGGRSISSCRAALTNSGACSSAAPAAAIRTPVALPAATALCAVLSARRGRSCSRSGSRSRPHFRSRVRSTSAAFRLAPATLTNADILLVVNPKSLLSALSSL
mmetsp:Transcript_3594/g.9994  ORF Transcript_3594/g.9994 Transcript_3594/m.9994 type:complete len:225 (+) Transcript_3594:636-1310(+)